MLPADVMHHKLKNITIDGKAAQLTVLHFTVHMKGTEPITKVSSCYFVTSYLTKSPFL